MKWFELVWGLVFFAKVRLSMGMFCSLEKPGTKLYREPASLSVKGGFPDPVEAVCLVTSRSSIYGWKSMRNRTFQIVTNYCAPDPPHRRGGFTTQLPRWSQQNVTHWPSKQFGFALDCQISFWTSHFNCCQRLVYILKRIEILRKWTEFCNFLLLLVQLPLVHTQRIRTHTHVCDGDAPAHRA